MCQKCGKGASDNNEVAEAAAAAAAEPEKNIRRIRIVPDEQRIIAKLTSELETAAREAIEVRKQKCFRIGVTGGPIVPLLAKALASIKTDLYNWHFFFCEERYLPDAYRETVMYEYQYRVVQEVPGLNNMQFKPVDITLPIEDAAKDYARRIRRDFGIFNKKTIPQFDLVVLNLGYDGHICGLFAGKCLVDVHDDIVGAMSDGPKPPPERISMTLPLLNNARQCIFVIQGTNKADVVRRTFFCNAPPRPVAASIRRDIVTLLMDTAAATLLPAEVLKAAKVVMPPAPRQLPCRCQPHRKPKSKQKRKPPCCSTPKVCNKAMWKAAKRWKYMQLIQLENQQIDAKMQEVKVNECA